MRVVLLALGIIAAVIALVVMDRSDPAPLPGDQQNADRDADVIVDAADITQFRADGSLQYHLQAAQIRHFEGDAMTSLETPTMSLHDAARPPWIASARTGTLRRSAGADPEDVLYLREAVLLEQTRADGERVRLTTTALDLYPGRQYAETDQDVMIDSLIGRTTATGLEGDLQLGMLRFFSSRNAPVHTVLLPEQFK
jgi:lipopolysaccharide export system protein LptC